MMYLLSGDGGFVTEDAFGSVGVAVVEWKVGATDVNTEVVAFGDRGGDGSQINGDLVNLAGLHQLRFEPSR